MRAAKECKRPSSTNLRLSFSSASAVHPSLSLKSIGRPLQMPRLYTLCKIQGYHKSDVTSNVDMFQNLKKIPILYRAWEYLLMGKPDKRKALLDLFKLSALN